ncbi:unnamed protein product [Caenorhabditis bovis]|uniref:Serpentine Receptor, class H n=1 Tax=Caenorhabditis bovis TaxID=2654633 RepID=A0A8S1EE70_9PELO|nr:unnamed protein product [Caenorhabditis bovis]
MHGFKWCLFNLQIWIYFTDLLASVLIAPRFYFCMIGGRAHGYLFKLGMTVPQLIYIGFGACGFMIASIAVLFIYRHQAVVPAGSLTKLKTRYVVIIVIINFLIYGNMTLPAVFTAPINQLQAIIDFLKIERCPPKDILDPAVYLLQFDYKTLLPYLIFLLVFIGSECGLLALHTSWLLFFSTLFQNLSKKTRRMQIKFLASLAAQIAIPTTLCYAPIGYCLVTTMIDHYWQLANDICVFVFTSHGLVSSICLLLFYDCYRDFLLNLLFGACQLRFNKNSTHPSEPGSLVTVF